jgi:hypothetical protein
MNPNEPHSTPRNSSSPNLPLDELQAEVDAMAGEGLFTPIEVEVLAAAPITILITPRSGENNNDLSSALNFIANKLFRSSDSARSFLFRGVKLTRLSQIMSTGCDVIPSTAPIYASPYPWKALEYGNVVMVFDSTKLDKTFRKVSKSESPATLSRLREEYPYVKEDGDWLWFSTVPPGDGRMGTIYESYYTFFIPGDPREALLLLFLVGNDRNALRAEFLKCTKTLS